MTCTSGRGSPRPRSSRSTGARPSRWTCGGRTLRRGAVGAPAGGRRAARHGGQAVEVDLRRAHAAAGAVVDAVVGAQADAQRGQGLAVAVAPQQGGVQLVALPRTGARQGDAVALVAVAAVVEAGPVMHDQA